MNQMKKPVTLRDEITQLTKDIAGVSQGVDEKLSVLTGKVQNSFEVLRNFVDGVVAALVQVDPNFEQKLRDSLETLALGRIKVQQDEQQKQIDSLVQGGHLVLATKVTEVALVIAEVTNHVGKLVSPRSAFSMESPDLPEWLKSELLGKSVGDTVKTPQAETLTLVEVYLPGSGKPPLNIVPSAEAPVVVGEEDEVTQDEDVPEEEETGDAPTETPGS